MDQICEQLGVVRGLQNREEYVRENDVSSTVGEVRRAHRHGIAPDNIRMRLSASYRADGEHPMMDFLRNAIYRWIRLTGVDGKGDEECRCRQVEERT